MTEYKILKFNQNIAEEFFNFCQHASLEKTQPAASNMWSNEWQDQKHTLPYILTYTDRFTEPNGEFFLLYKDNDIIGCSGVYISQFSNEIALAGARTWIVPQFRHLLLPRELLLPAQKKWATEKKLKLVALTFNDYNKNMIVLWRRMRLGENRSVRRPEHLFFNGVNEIEFPVTIQHTKQWVIYEKLDQSWDFDWSSIRSE